MEANRRFSILIFPQFFNGNTLTVNIVVLPRNQNPLKKAIENNMDSPNIPDAPPFAKAKLTFEAKIISGLTGLPNSRAATSSQLLTVAPPTDAQALFKALAKNFKIDNLNQTNENLDINQDKANPAVTRQKSVKKYLPHSYRQAFNFTSPRTRNAVTNDSYLCAVRNAENVPTFKPSTDNISWGKVFAYGLRQPNIAKELGMIYEAKLNINVSHYPQGGWLYIDLAADSDYKDQQNIDDSFIKKYGARIPILDPAKPRQVFAPLLFPVLYKEKPSDPDPDPDGNYDTLFIEAAEYDDGFAKIVHAQQPPSRDLLAEDSDGAPPVKDAGIRLGWDDEQILIWYMRQMMIDPTVLTSPDKRLDAPLGVFGYAVDIREMANPENPWESLNRAKSKAQLMVPKGSTPAAGTIDLGKFDGELPFQVYPMQLGGNTSNNYWLPMYFAGWNGKSIVLPDNDAAEIYKTIDKDIKGDPTGTGVTKPAANQLSKVYDAPALNTTLRYGKQYAVRVRLRDLSGGGAPWHPAVNPVNESASGEGRVRFKRYVAPSQPRISNLSFNTDTIPNNITQLVIQRPLLGYPAVVYTDKYTNPVSLLKTASQQMMGKEAFGIADPDVDRVEVIVEVEALKMDNLLSVSGKDNYVHLYTTTRAFPAVNTENDYKSELTIPVTYKDCKVLHTGAEADPTTDLQLTGDIDDLTEIVVPTARNIRLTIRALCEEKPENHEYYGLHHATDRSRDSRFGHAVEVMMYRESTDETDLFVDASPAKKLQSIYLQPDPVRIFDGKLVTRLIGKTTDKTPKSIQRLAKQLGLETIGMTLTAPKGERIQFGCSNRINHTLAPDNSSITFSTAGDLMHHWLCCITLDIERDWTWDGLEDMSFKFNRTKYFTRDHGVHEADQDSVGGIEVRRTASFESMHNPKRNYTRLIFIDAVEPKNHRLQPPPKNTEPYFPDTIEVGYTIETFFKLAHAAERDDSEQLDITLPITTPPAQVPKVASAGIALSPYLRNEQYSATEPRKRYLWVEFDESVKNPNTTVFARVLSYAPDQLLSNNHPDLIVAQPEPALPVDPEYIRVITPGASNDLAGLNAMQPMEKATDSDKHYLLPLPHGLHADADEMFGFFTYEFRLGHYRDQDTQDMVWTTAQGRFGRPLSATGIQHPAPTLTCTVNRDEEKIHVSAPYAVAVHKGKNVTAEPPRSQLWCLLYAQVKQADNRDYRNILLDDKQLDWRVQVEKKTASGWLYKYDDKELDLLKKISIKNWKDEVDYGNYKHFYKLIDFVRKNKDAIKYGTVVWGNQEIRQLLELYGLPLDSSLSVLVVEILPTIANAFEQVSNLDRPEVIAKLRDNIRMFSNPELADKVMQYAKKMQDGQEKPEGPSPVNEELGHHRILRTSPLTEVPFVC